MFRHDRQAQAGALTQGLARRAAPGPALQQTLRLGLVHAGAVVDDRQANLAGQVPGELDRDPGRRTAGGPGIPHGVVDQVVEHPFEQGALRPDVHRGVDAASAQVHALRVGTVQVAQQGLAHHRVERQDLGLQDLLGLLGQCDRQQLVNAVAGLFLAAQDLSQLLAPDLRVRLRQAVLGQGADAGQRRAQLVGHIARKLLLAAHGVAQPAQQGIDGQGQALDVPGAVGHRQRREVTRIALGHRVFQVHQGLHILLDGAAQPQRQQAQQQDLRRHRDQQQLVKMAVAAAGGLPHHHFERGRLRARNDHHTQGLVLEIDFGEVGGMPGWQGRQAEPGVSGQQVSIVQVDRKVHGLVLVEQQGAHFGRRQAQREAAVFGVPHMGGHGIGVIEQGAVKGFLGEMAGHGQRHQHAQQPGQGERDDDVPQQTVAQGRQGFHAAGEGPVSSSMR